MKYCSELFVFMLELDWFWTYVSSDFLTNAASSHIRLHLVNEISFRNFCINNIGTAKLLGMGGCGKGRGGQMTAHFHVSYIMQVFLCHSLHSPSILFIHRM